MTTSPLEFEINVMSTIFNMFQLLMDMTFLSIIHPWVNYLIKIKKIYFLLSYKKNNKVFSSK